MVDGIGVEDLFSNGRKLQRAKEVEYRLGPLRAFATKTKKPVYLIDYAKKGELAADLE